MTREEAIKMLKSKMDGHTDTSYEWAETVRMAIKALEQEESKTGYWIYDKHKSDWYDSIYRCSCCGRTILISFDKKADVNLCRDYPYCHCGAKMEEEE